MEVEVSWRDIKKLLPPNCSLGQFLGALCHYIKTCLGEEQMQRLGKVGSCSAFICEPISTKELWVGVQSAHSKTLSSSIVVMTSSKRSFFPESRRIEPFSHASQQETGSSLGQTAHYAVTTVYGT
jgi:hypothetical protein